MLFRKIFNEFICLILWIDHQRPSSCFINDYTILGRVIVFWQLCDVPSLNFNGLAQKLSHGNVLSMRKSNLFDFYEPRFLHFLSVGTGKWPNIANHTCRNYTVTSEQFHSFL
jgi:hypothetical protein